MLRGSAGSNRCTALGGRAALTGQRIRLKSRKPRYIALVPAHSAKVHELGKWISGQMMASKADADDVSVPIAPTPAIEGVDHNGLVVGKWKNGLFGSCYTNCVPNAITPCLCPGISMAQVCARLGIANFFAVLVSYLSVDGLVFGAAVTKVDVLSTLAVIMSVLVALFTIRIRFRMRYLFSIPGSLMEDIFTSVFCCCCAIAQMADHSESFEINTFAVLPRATLPGYTFG